MLSHKTINVDVSLLMRRTDGGRHKRESNKSTERAWRARDGNCTCQTLFCRSTLFRFHNYVALELRAPLSRDKRQATDDTSKKATAAPDPVARRPFRMIARFYVFIPGSRRARFSPRRRFCFSIANRNSFRSQLVSVRREISRRRA